MGNRPEPGKTKEANSRNEKAQKEKESDLNNLEECCGPLAIHDPLPGLPWGVTVVTIDGTYYEKKPIRRRV